MTSLKMQFDDYEFIKKIKTKSNLSFYHRKRHLKCNYFKAIAFFQDLLYALIVIDQNFSLH